MPQVDPVILQLKADIADYQRDLTRAERLSGEKLDRIGRAGTATGVALRKGFDLAKGAAVAFAASISVEAVYGAIKSGLEYAANLGEQAKALGITTDALQEYSYAATQVGLTQSELETGIIRLTRALGEAADDADGPAAKAFEKLGVEIRDADGNVRNAAEILPDIAQGYAQLGSDAERSAAGFDLLGRGAAKFATLLEGGAEGVNGLRKAAQDLGIVLSSEQIASADNAADKLESVKKVLEAKIAGTVANNADSIIRLADSLGRLADRALRAFDALQRLSNSRLGKFINGANDLLQYATPAGAAAKAISTGFSAADRAFGGGTGGAAPRPRPQAKIRTTPLPGLEPYKFNAAPETDNPFGAPGAGSAAALALLASAPSEAARVVAAMTSEVEALEAEVAAARAELSGNLEDAAAAEKQQIDARTRAEVERLEADAKERKVDNSKLIANQQLLGSLQKQAVDAQLAEDLAREANDQKQHQLGLASDQIRREIDALSVEADLADTRSARLVIERRILELRQQAERDELEAQIARDATINAEKARAALARRQSAEGVSLERDFEGPLARYGRDARNADERVAEAAARRIADLNDTIADTMTRSLGVKDPFLRDLLRIFLDQNVFGPLAEALSKRQSGGLFGSILSAIGLFSKTGSSSSGVDATMRSTDMRGLFGRAIGGPVAAGQSVRVGEYGEEVFTPTGFGNITPAHALRAGAADVNQTITIQVDANGAVLVDQVQRMVQQGMQVAAQVGATTGGAMGEQRVMSRGRRRIPG